MAENKVKLILETQAQTQGIVGAINALRGLGGAANMVEHAFRRMAAPLLTALSGGGLIAAARSALNAADDLAKSAQRAGVAVEEFSAFAYVGRLAAVSADQLVQANKFLSQWMEKTGQSGRDLTQVLIEQADAFARMPDGADKIRLAIERFGRSGQQLIPLLNQGGDAIRRTIDEAEQFGLVMGPRFAANVQTFNDNFTRMWGIFRGMFNLLADALLPTFIEWQERIIKWVKDTDVHIAVVDSLIQTYQGFAMMIATIGALFDIAGGAAGRFLGNLSVTGSVTEAFKASGDAANEALDKLEQKLNRIAEISRKGRDKTKPGEAIPAPVDALKNLEMHLEKTQLRIQLTNANATLSDRERNQDLRGIYEERFKLLEQMQEHLKKEAPDELVATEKGVRFTQRYSEVSKELNATLREQAELQSKIFEIDSDSFFGRLHLGFRKMADEVENLGATIADVMMSGVKRSIDAVADGIWAVVDGTRTWGEIFLDVGRSIISDLIRIAIQETVVLAIKKGALFTWKALQTAFRAADVAEANATEAAKTPALAANATLASIGSFGVAVVIGLAAIAGILASIGAFETGGVVKGGRQIVMVNERGPEGILNAQATARLGESGIAALNAGDFESALDLEDRMVDAYGLDSAPVQRQIVLPPAEQSGGRTGPINIMIVDSRNSQAARDFMASSAGQALIADAVRDRRIEIGIPS